VTQLAAGTQLAAWTKQAAGTQPAEGTQQAAGTKPAAGTQQAAWAQPAARTKPAAGTKPAAWMQLATGTQQAAGTAARNRMGISNSNRNARNIRDASVSIDIKCTDHGDVLATAQKFTKNNMKMTKNSGRAKNVYLHDSQSDSYQNIGKLDTVLNARYYNNLVFLTGSIRIYHNSSAHLCFYEMSLNILFFCLFHPAEKGDSLHLVYTAYTRLRWKRFLSYMKIFRLILCLFPP
jgi:hypothetical protein